MHRSKGKKEPFLPISEPGSVTLYYFIPIDINWDGGKGDQGGMMRKESEINMRFVRLAKICQDRWREVNIWTPLHLKGTS
jgi:hypothetical protein